MLTTSLNDAKEGANIALVSTEEMRTRAEAWKKEQIRLKTEMRELNHKYEEISMEKLKVSYLHHVGVFNYLHRSLPAPCWRIQLYDDSHYIHIYLYTHTNYDTCLYKNVHISYSKTILKYIRRFHHDAFQVRSKILLITRERLREYLCVYLLI